MTATRTLDNETIPASGTWDLDTVHSDLRIVARHLMVAKVRGTFEELSGTIVVADDPLESRVEIEAKAASVTTGAPDRDAHLRSPDFLDADRYPLVRFVSTDLTRQGSDWKLTGDLTIRGVTKPVTFDMSFEGAATDPYGTAKAAFGARGEIDRREWGLEWNVPLENGGVLVSEKLKVEFDVEATLRS